MQADGDHRGGDPGRCRQSRPRGGAQIGRDIFGDAPHQPRKRDGAHDADADDHLEVHVVAVNANIRVRNAGVPAVEKTEAVRTDAEERVRDEHPRGRAPQREPSRPHGSTRQRIGRQRSARERAGHRRSRERQRSAGLRAEPQPPFLDDVPGQAILAGLARRPHTCVQRDGVIRRNGRGERRPQSFEDDDAIGGRLEPVIREINRRILARVPRQSTRVRDADRHFAHAAGRQRDVRRRADPAAVPFVLSFARRPQPDSRKAGR